MTYVLCSAELVFIEYQVAESFIRIRHSATQFNNFERLICFFLSLKQGFN
jgi:hypothetical protein